MGKGADADRVKIEWPTGDSDSRVGCHYHTDLANVRWRGLQWRLHYADVQGLAVARGLEMLTKQIEILADFLEMAN